MRDPDPFDIMIKGAIVVLMMLAIVEFVDIRTDLHQIALSLAHGEKL